MKPSLRVKNVNKTHVQRELSRISSLRWNVFFSKFDMTFVLNANQFNPLKIHTMNRLIQSTHFKYGAPFILCIVGGSYGLKYYSQLRYDIQHERHIITKTKAMRELAGVSKPAPTIEEEYKEYTEKVDLDNWKNIRGPRPWESDNTEYKEVIEKRIAESKNQWIFKK